jgi:hypothetical protein
MTIGKSAADKGFRQNMETKQTAVLSVPEGHVDTSRSWSKLEFAITRVKIQAKGSSSTRRFTEVDSS